MKDKIFKMFFNNFFLWITAGIIAAGLVFFYSPANARESSNEQYVFIDRTGPAENKKSDGFPIEQGTKETKEKVGLAEAIALWEKLFASRLSGDKNLEEKAWKDYQKSLTQEDMQALGRFARMHYLWGFEVGHDINKAPYTVCQPKLNVDPVVPLKKAVDFTADLLVF